MRRFESKVVFITGSGSGLGREAALRFAAEGAVIAGADLLANGNQQTKQMVEAAGGKIHIGDAVDLTNEAQTRAWIAHAVAALGSIDVLFACAGATKFSPVAETSIDEWQWVLKHELDLVFLPVKNSWQHLKKSAGNVVLVGSTAGVSGSMTNTRVAHSATKGGVIAMAKQLAGEGAVHGVRVNSVSPGMIRTPATEGDLLAEDHPMRNIQKSIPLQRIGTPAEVISCVLFLASNDASYVTGHNLMVDGGWSSVLPGYGLV
jgi:meso-butanediol dehydrogenase/(S,S)-butanediol dehydrogenase/diacetyl reductase